MGSGNALSPPLQSVINACIKCVHLPGPVPRIETSVRHGPAHRGPLGCGTWGVVSDQKQGVALDVGDPGSALRPPWGKLGGLRAGGDLASEALVTPRCALRPTSSSLLSWTCSCFCLFHTALP